MNLPPDRLSNLPSPLLTSKVDKTPWSERFQDTYFDRDDGLAESRHVFLDGCGLPDAWQHANTFVIGETGFGTGLNFLAVWDLWLRTRPTNGLLHYVSIDGFPLTSDELGQCLQPILELQHLCGRLNRAYPMPQRGFHRLFFDDDGVILTLIFEDVEKALSDLSATVDAWFLDGFAPSKNPAMWTTPVLNQIGQLSKPGTRVATFSVAGSVRQGLAEAGFTVSKRSGAGRKREVLSGLFTGSETSGPAKQPWFTLPSPINRKSAAVTVIGGGLAGAYTAHAFRRRGHRVRVIEAEDTLSAGASAAPGAVVMPRMSLGQGDEEAFLAQAWRQARGALCNANATLGHSVFHGCGVLDCALTPERRDRLQALAESGHDPRDRVCYVSAEAASDIASVTLDHAALYMADAGWVDAPRLIDWLTQTAECEVSRRIGSLQFHDGDWTVLGQRADMVILANSLGVTAFDQSRNLPLNARLGQLTALTPVTESKSLSAVLIGGVHLTPPVNGRHFAGATFDHVSATENASLPIEPDVEADRRNLAGVQALLPRMFDDTAIDRGADWAGLRCVTPDHLPIAGPVPDHAPYGAAYADLHHGRHWKSYPDAPYHHGLYTLTGLGARGHLTAPLAAELVASQALNEPLPVPRTVSDLLHPGRFTIRSLRRPPA